MEYHKMRGGEHNTMIHIRWKWM